MENPVDEVRAFLLALEPRPHTLLVAVSGGLDSSVLLGVLASWTDRPFRIVAGFVDHGLREGSETDGRIVEELCERFGIDRIARRVRVESSVIGERGVEAAAREARYETLRQMLREIGADRIATAHHQDDQAETVIMRLLQRGSVTTLRGIRSVSEDGVIVRPLLGISKTALIDLAHSLDIENWIVDPMNADPRFLRARVRHVLLPFLAGAWRSVESDLARAADSFADLERLAGARLDYYESLWSMNSGSVEIEAHELPRDEWLRRALLRRVVTRLAGEGRSVSMESLSRLTRQPELSRRSVGAGLSLSIAEGGIRLFRDDEKDQPDESIEETPLTPGSEVLVAGVGRVEVRRIIEPPPCLKSSDGATQVIGVRPGCTATFSVRTRRSGDRFRPLGLEQSCKLTSFLIDRKVPVEQRESLPLFIVNEKIGWIPGVEVADEFRVEEGRDLYELLFRAEP